MLRCCSIGHELKSCCCRVGMIGGGYIACEQASIYNNFGAEVHFFIRGVRSLPVPDHERTQPLAYAPSSATYCWQLCTADRPTRWAGCTARL